MVQSLAILGGACLCAVIGVGAAVALVVLWRRQNQTFDVEDEPAPKAAVASAPKVAPPASPKAAPRPRSEPLPPPPKAADELPTVMAPVRPVPAAPPPPPPPPPKAPPKPGDAPDPGFVKVPQRSSGQTIIAFDDDLDDDDK